MNRRELLKGLVGGAVSMALAPKLWAQAPGVPAGPRPNILWLVIEDTSAYEFGCYGNSAVKTPVIAVWLRAASDSPTPGKKSVT